MFALDPKTANSRISSLADEYKTDRRGFLGVMLSAFASGLSGCGGRSGTTNATNTSNRQPPAPLVITSLDTIVPLAGMHWLVVARPKEIASIAWLEPSIAKLLDKERLDSSALQMGFDLRTLTEAVWAAYHTEDAAEDASFQLVRHTSDPLVIERLFRDRLTADMVRSIDDPRVVRVSGRIGKTVHVYAGAGREVACLQQDGSADRGPCRVASLLALGKLKRSRSVFEDEAMRVLAKRFETAPLRIFAPGPFEGDLARGARGLLAAATAVGAAFRPSPRQTLLLDIAVAGDFSTSASEASRKLEASWEDLAARPLGHLLGLDAPLAPAFPSYAPDHVAFVVELDARKLAQGLADATSNEMREIMR